MEYRLITAVSGFPCLYDRSSPTYRDLNMRSDAWREVSQLVGVNEPDCRRKWKMLRDQHRRERYRERERRESGVGLLNYRPWRYAAILSFLNPFTDSRAAGTNGWALEPRGAQPDLVGCSDDDDSYGEPPPRPRPRRDQQVLDPLSSAGVAVAVADATTTTTTGSSAPERKRPSSVSAADVRQKEARLERSAAAAAAAPPAGVRELCETMMQAVTSLAASLAEPPSWRSAGAASLLLKTEEPEGSDAEPLEPTDDEDESPRAARCGRRAADSPLEDRARSEEPRRDPGVEPRDHVTLFLLSLAPAVRRLPAEKQSWLKTKIQQLVHEAEFGPTSFQ